MPVVVALAASVGVLAVLATWLFGLHPIDTMNMQVWQAFIAWGCHFHSGAKLTGARNTVVCMSFGAVVGMGAIMLAGVMGGLGAFAAPIAVGIGATIIVLASKAPPLEVIPASVYGFAAFAGLVLLKEPKISPIMALLPTVLSIIVGAAFGYGSEVLAAALTKKSVTAVAAEASGRS